MAIPPLTKPLVLTDVWCDQPLQSGDIATPSNTQIAEGWQQSNIPPPRQWFNWFFNYVQNGVRYFARRGLTDYDAAETYLIGDKVTGPDNISYVSLVNANIGNTPSSHVGTKWDTWGWTGTALASYITALGLRACAFLGIGNGLKNDGSSNLTINLADANSLKVDSNGLRAMEQISYINASRNIAASDNGATLAFSAAGKTLTLPLASSLWNGFYYEVLTASYGGTIAPQSTDHIFDPTLTDLGAGTAFVAPAKKILRVSTDGAEWIIKAISGTAARQDASSNTGTVAAVSGAVVAGHVPVFSDTLGTMVDGGPAGAAASATPITGATSVQPGVFEVDTSSGPFTITLIPTTVDAQNWTFYDHPSIDGPGSWGTNNLTINLGGMTLVFPNGQSSNTTLVQDVSGENFRLSYDAATSTLRVS